LGSEYLIAIQEGNLPYATRLMDAMLDLKNNGKLIENTDKVTESVVREQITATQKEKIYAPLRGSGLCYTDDTMFKRLFTIITSIDQLRRINALITSIGELKAETSLTTTLQVAEVLALAQRAVLTVGL
jgi:hypothetical protein